jgi:uncharacterized protein
MQNNRVMQKITERLLELRIDKNRIQTSSFLISPQYKPQPRRSSDGPQGTPEIIGYRINNSLTVEVRNPQHVATIIEAALAAGANHFQGVHWALRDEQHAKELALKQAATKAREKAALLSQALQVELLRVVSANEHTQCVRPMAQVSLRSMSASEEGPSEKPLHGLLAECLKCITQDII